MLCQKMAWSFARKQCKLPWKQIYLSGEKLHSDFPEIKVEMHVQMVQPPETFVSLGTLVSAAKIVSNQYFGVKFIHHFQMMMSHVLQY